VSASSPGAAAAPAGTRFIDAIRSALDEALAADLAVCLFGEDITMGGPFGATKGLVDTHGEARIRNTPISEATVMGLAVGAALAGRRPVVEIMFVDFLTLAMDQLVNHAAKLRYMSGGQLSVPLTVRVQGGAAGGMGAHHSQSLEGWLMAIPGLKLATASTPADAKAILAAAIRDDDPVVVLEHRGLYFQRGPVPAEPDPAAALGAVVRREGTDVTIVAWSKMVGTALEAAETLAADGISVEVVDARWLLPLDADSLARSVRKTGRLVVLHEAVEQGGPGGEVAMRVQEVVGKALVRPPVRIGAPFAPVPAGPEMERAFIPSAARVVHAVGALVRGDA
jgi:pyruvate dehydrogenase E1 component beta subunit